MFVHPHVIEQITEIIYSIQMSYISFQIKAHVTGVTEIMSFR